MASVGKSWSGALLHEAAGRDDDDYEDSQITVLIAEVWIDKAKSNKRMRCENPDREQHYGSNWYHNLLVVRFRNTWVAVPFDEEVACWAQTEPCFEMKHRDAAHTFPSEDCLGTMMRKWNITFTPPIIRFVL